MVKECRFIRANGLKCQSPALRGAHFCYFRARTRVIVPRRRFRSTVPDSRPTFRGSFAPLFPRSLLFYSLLPTPYSLRFCSLVRWFPRFLCPGACPERSRRISTSLGPSVPKSLSPEVPVFTPPPYASGTHPHPFSRPHPPMPFCETVKL
jgi:hypothetical protein